MTNELIKLQTKAAKFVDEKKFIEIIDLLNDQVLETYRDPELYTWRARGHYNLEQYDDSLKYAQKASDKDNKYWRSYFTKAYIYHAKGDYDKAIANNNIAIDLNANEFASYYNRGLAWSGKKDYDKAIIDYSKTLKLNPKYPQAYASRGLAWYYKSDYNKAIADYNKAIKLNLKDANTYHNRGIVWNEKGNYDKAIADFNVANKLKPELASSYYGKALAYESKRQLKEALKSFQKCVELNHRVSDAQYRIARLQNLISITLKEEIKKDIDKIKSIVNAIRKKCIAKNKVKQVVHYSTLKVANIVTNDCTSHLHYGNVIYMNDPQEGKTFFEYLNDPIISEWYQKSSYKNESTIFLGSFLPVNEGADDSAEDQLLMWRTYGKDENGSDAGGCNFVINTAFFKDEETKTKFPLPDTFSKIRALIEKGTIIPDDDRKSLLEVQYIRKNKIETDDNRQTLKQLIDYLKEKIKELINKNEKEKDNLDAKLFTDSRIFDALQELCHLFKAADYEFEKEVRIISAEPRNSENILYYKEADGTEKSPPWYFYLKSAKRVLPYLDKIYLGPKVQNASHWGLHLDYSLRKAHKQEMKEVDELIELRKRLKPEESRRLQQLELLYNGIADFSKEEIKPDQVEIIPSKCRFV